MTGLQLLYSFSKWGKESYCHAISLQDKIIKGDDKYYLLDSHSSMNLNILQSLIYMCVYAVLYSIDYKKG